MSQYHHLETSDYAIAIVLTALSCCLGFYYAYKARNTVNNTEFLLKPKIGLIPIILSVVATRFSVTGLLSFTSDIYNYGIVYTECLIGIALSIPVMILFYLPVFYKFQGDTIFKVSHSI